MTRYDDWNNAIYKYYFENKFLSSDFLFFVDENILQEIGKNFGTENVIQDFCKCIRNRITYNDKIDLDQSNGVSYRPEGNTAIIAFFIYIASCLGEKQVDNFIDSYWEICANKLNIKVKNNQSVFEYNAQNKKKYFDMFNKFAEFINNNHGLNFKFTSLYKRSEGQSDYIGLPISQSMVSTKDRYLLSQVFGKYEDKKFDYIYHYVMSDLYGYSKILRKLCYDPKYSEKIKETLKYLRENWDHVVVEIDEKSKTGSRILSSPLLIGFYKTQHGDFKLGVTTYNKGYEGLTFRYKNIEYQLSPLNNSKFYPLNTNFFENGNAVFHDYLFSTNYKMQLKSKSVEKNFILLTKAEDGSYIQVPNNFVMQHTQFSILGTREFFENDYEDYFGDYVEELKEPLATLTKNIYVVTDLYADSYDNEYIKLSVKNKVRLKKGLKIDRNTYVEGAGPIISVNNLSNIEILDSIRKTVYKNANAHKLIIDESKDYDIDSYKITCNYTDIGESFSINDISMVESGKSDERIYQTINPIEITKIYSEEKPEQYVIGAMICGFDIIEDEEDTEDDLLTIEDDDGNSEDDLLTIDEYNRRAKEFFENEQYELAIENWEKVLELNSEYEINYDDLARAQEAIGDTDSALTNYLKYLEAYTDDDEVYNNIGNIYANRDDYENAVKYYQAACDCVTENPLYLKELANIYNLWADSIKSEDLETAQLYYTNSAYYNEMLESNPAHNLNYYQLALENHKAGEFDSALKNYKKYLKIYPNHSDTYNNIGIIYQDKGEYDKAVKNYEKAHKLDTKDPVYIHNLAKTYYDWAWACDLEDWDSQTAKQYYEKAVEYYQKVLELDSEYKINYFRFAYAQDKVGDKDSALENYQKFLEIYPNKSYIYNFIGNIYKYKGEYDKAIENYEKAHKLDTKDILYINNLARTYYDWANSIKGKDYQTAKQYYARAVEYYQKVLELDSEYNINYLRFAYAQDIVGDKDSALENYKRHLKTYPNNSYTYNNIGIIYQNKGEYSKAVENYEKAHKLDTKDTVYINNLAETYYYWANSIRSEDYQTAKQYYARAVEYYQKVQELNSEYYIDYFSLAYAQAETGDADSALENYKRHLKTYPNNSYTYNNIGVIYKNKGDCETAVKYYSKAIELDSDNEIARNNFHTTISELVSPIHSKVQALDGNKDYQAIYELAKDALQRGLETAEIYHFAGYALFKSYDIENDEALYNEAISNFEKAYEMVQNGQYYNKEVAEKIEQNYQNIVDN